MTSIDKLQYQNPLLNIALSRAITCPLFSELFSKLWLHTMESYHADLPIAAFVTRLNNEDWLLQKIIMFRDQIFKKESYNKAYTVVILYFLGYIFSQNSLELKICKFSVYYSLQ